MTDFRSSLEEYVYAHRLHDSRIHGIDHWRQVEFNGLLLAKVTGADEVVVRLFALFHDCKRMDDGYDINHGPRGAEFAKTCFEEGRINISKEQFDKLYHACKFHTSEHASGDATIDTCYDADRLDLGRVDILLNPKKMATLEGARIAQLSRNEHVSAKDMRVWLRQQK